jgi:UDP-N-acetylglucosamine 2-epimerase (non-hydrolysing)
MTKKIKIMVVVGARPNFIKIAPLFWEFRKRPEFAPILIHTGQHYDYEMSQIFFNRLSIPKPDYYLGIGSESHAVQTAKMMIALEEVYNQEHPSMVLVIGDVNSTLAAALVAVKLHIPIGHVEAGPRMFDKTMPEEVNRILTDHISDFLFCPTAVSVENLRKEGITKRVYFTGDTMYDAFLEVLELIRNKEAKILTTMHLKPKSYILLTLHRPANVDNELTLKMILGAVAESGEKIIFPVHPRTNKKLVALSDYFEKDYRFNNVVFMSPVGYAQMVILQKNAKKICTDSGGIQKEAYWLKLPCITLMETTGWPETDKDGWNIPVGSNGKKITNAIKNFNPQGCQNADFGKGDASKKIIEIIKHHL